MGLRDIKNPDDVITAIREYDELGQQAFLAQYGFAESRSHVLWYRDKPYDSKAILGVAHRFARPDLGALKASDFTGGTATVQHRLESLGFEVRVAVGAASVGKTSERLETGRVYPRKELIEQFGITDATVNTGVFHVPGTGSLWLFVTKEMTKDRRPYQNSYDGETLQWQGQAKGRTDQTIISHARNGLELLVFYRKNKFEHPGAGFQFLGEFEYESHSGAQPTNFVLRRVGAGGQDGHTAADVESVIQRDDIPETTKKALVDARRGQGKFKAEAFGIEPRCRVTGLGLWRHLRASHIKPWRDSTDLERLDGHNGLLLAPHVDHLFDQGFISFADDGQLLVSTQLDPAVLTSWSISPDIEARPFNLRQQGYLAYHREFRFKP